MRNLSTTITLVSSALALAGCQASNVDVQPGDTDTGDTDSATDSDTGSDADTDTDTDADTDSDTEVWTPPLNSLVYANTEENLYKIDPAESSDLVLVGALSGPCTSGSGLYDIAITGDGLMVGIAAEALYSIDTETAECTVLKALPDGSPHFFSLSWVVGVDPDAPTEERLMAASVEEGEWVEVDPEGTTVDEIFLHVGYHDVTTEGGAALVSSGDIVAVQVAENEWATYATLKCQDGYAATGCDTDFLASIDAETGEATLIGTGTSGFTKIFGLGFWGDEVYGFTNNAEVITIDVTTGLATEVLTHDAGFWGAGTTTKPFVVIE